MTNQSFSSAPASSRDWFSVGWLVVTHVLAAAAFFFFSWGAFVVFLSLYFVTACLGITMGFHRMLSHRSFKAHRWLEAFLALCGTLALQGGPLQWVAKHRMHHGYSDTGRDPHDASRGFWFSHMGWILQRTPEFDDASQHKKYLRDLAADPVLGWLSLAWVQVSLQVGLGVILLLAGGVGYVLWGVFFRLAFVYHVTWLVNSAAHVWGYRTYRTEDRSTNLWWVGLLAFGEGWHNNHHAQPGAVHVQHRWWEIDVTWMMIRVFHALGWVDSLRMPELSERSVASEARVARQAGR